MSPDITGADRPRWVESLEGIEAAEPEVLAFLDEPNRRARLSHDTARDGALQGLPLAVKDLYRVDGLPTRAGSALPAELFAGPESWIVTTLRTAGAVVMGKTAMDEFGYCEPPPTRNPRDLSRSPDGSSGGSAAAVAAGMCPVALGSQTLHSTIGPAAYCGVVGYKPSFGRWPFDGVGAAPSFDTLGFLAADVATTTRVASVLPGWQPTNATRPVLGVPELWGIRRLHTEGWTAFAHHAETLKAAGYEIRTARVPWNDDVADWSSVITDLMLAEFAEIHRDWFDAHRSLYRPRTAEAIERGRMVSAERVAECRTRKAEFAAALTLAADQAGIDCWICPSAGTVATPLHDAVRETWMTRFWSLSGWPTLSLPIFDGENGLPHGLQVVARHQHDEDLLHWATDLRRALPANAT